MEPVTRHQEASNSSSAVNESQNNHSVNCCKVCGVFDNDYDEHSEYPHSLTEKHKCNEILEHYKKNEDFFASNREGINVSGLVETGHARLVEENTNKKIWANVIPKEEIKYVFKIWRDSSANYEIIGIQLAHPQPQFEIVQNFYEFETGPHSFDGSEGKQVRIRFYAEDIGHYEMPIMFTFKNKKKDKILIIVRKMAASVSVEKDPFVPTKSPYRNIRQKRTSEFIPSINHIPYENKFCIPKYLKKILPCGLEDNVLNKYSHLPDDEMNQLREDLNKTRNVFQTNISDAHKRNYTDFFQYLLWWEEIIVRINIKQYNMPSVTIEERQDGFYLHVPGLAEKRPSLLLGDRIIITPEKCDITFESIVKKMENEYVKLGDLQECFDDYYSEDRKFSIQFLMSRVPLERMHEAVTNVFVSKQECRVFPKAIQEIIPVKKLRRFFNKTIESNPEQRCAVEHIVSGTSGLAPYIVYGPPGTGKTVTIVEAIIQLVMQSPKNRIMVCTDSNMAADHIALELLKYSGQLNINNYLKRVNAKTRTWTGMPTALSSVSNGHNVETFRSVSNSEMSSYRVVVTTLLHAAKYNPTKKSECKLVVSHLFIDEAGQASEPTALVPVCGVLAPRGCLVLAGDPKQLGPVLVCNNAKQIGLGKSLLERLQLSYANLYDINPGKIDHNYITILLKNFRNHPDILQISNELFYQNLLQPLATEDPLSTTKILQEEYTEGGGDKAIVFHSVHSKEQRLKHTPSFYNVKELELLKRYVKALLHKHGVAPQDIGIITPYIRQVHRMKEWLVSQEHEEIEVGTVESYQGKEKRVILISTVRANCQLLDYDAKYGLGFLVDDKRFNVALTRAKAKLIIVGNWSCLTRDRKWRIYMDLCKQYKCYFGEKTQQLERNSKLLHEIAKTRFDQCLMTKALAMIEKK